MKELVDQGAEIDAEDAYGWTAVAGSGIAAHRLVYWRWLVRLIVLCLSLILLCTCLLRSRSLLLLPHSPTTSWPRSGTR